MTTLPRADLPVRYNFTTAAIGQIDCQRIGVGALLSLGEAAARGEITPEEMARGFLKRVGRKPDAGEPRGSLLDDNDVAAVSTSELEEFAELTIAENDYLYQERADSEVHAEIVGSATAGGSVYLERASGESAIDFLARAVAMQPERQAAKAAKVFGRAGLGQSSAALMKSMFPLASRLATSMGMGASQRAAADLLRAKSASEVAYPKFEGIEKESLIDRIAAIPEPQRPSDTTLEVLQDRIDDFSSRLQSEEEVGLISNSSGVSFYVKDRKAISREMIALQGFDTDGNVVELVQHYTQFSVALIALPKVSERRPIGFTSDRVGTGEGGLSTP